MTQNDNETVDVLLVGAGIMSTTLAALLKELDPSLTMEIVEQCEHGAMESSNPWNNAGTGHAGLCELNYTPVTADGELNITKALNIHAQFGISKQLWAHLVERGAIPNPREFLNPVPHMSFVQTRDGVSYLQKRFEAMKQHHAFKAMEYSQDKIQLQEWLPLMMTGRSNSDDLAATRVNTGTDVNFGALTRNLLHFMVGQPGIHLRFNQRVTGLHRHGKGWRIHIKDSRNNDSREVFARFVFLGAGGGALPLLQMSGIEEGKGYAGFPVSGQWLRCDNPDVVEQHQAKVYSQASIGAPPMSVPHLDTRVVDGKKSLLFGPYAGFTTKFLKRGSIFDMPFSIRPDNIWPMLSVARDNMDLTRYLISEVRQSLDQRLDSLRQFYPTLNRDDWRLEKAGQRVQIIKKDSKKGGILQFGTELVAARDGSIAALLGASPGASVSVSIMIKLIQFCFAEKVRTQWEPMLKQIFIARETELQNDPDIYRETMARCDELLQLPH